MKEATGELSTTVIAIVAIAAIAAIFSVFLLPTIKSSLISKTYCTSAICSPDKCVSSEKTCKCSYIDNEDASNNKDVVCENPYYKSTP